MAFFKKNYANISALQIEDYIPVSVYQHLLPKHQKLLEKLFNTTSPQLEKFLSKISSNGVIVTHEMLERMIEQLFTENQIPFQALSIEVAKNCIASPLTHQYPDAFKFFIQIIQELKIWKNLNIDETTIYHHFNVIDKMISSDIELNFSEQNSKTPFWKKQPSFPEMTAFKFLFENFKYFHSDEMIQAKRPMNLYELYCLFEEAVLARNLTKTSSEHQAILRALHASAMIFTAIKIFPAAFPDFIAYHVDNSPINAIPPLALTEDENFNSFFGRHPHLQKFNEIGFYLAFNTWIEQLQKNYKLSETTDIKDWLKDALLSDEVFQQNSESFQNIFKRLIFIFNRLTISGYLLRSPVLKGLGYHPLIHTEYPIKFLENYPLFISYFKDWSEQEKDDFLDAVLLFNHYKPISNPLFLSTP